MKRRPRTWAVTAALVVALLGGAWTWGSGHSAGRVRVSWSPQSPTCDATRVDRAGREPVIAAVPGMRCVIRVRIHNDGRVPVRLDSARAPMSGARTGAVVAADNADPSLGDGLDAVYRIDETLGPDRSTTFEIVTVFHPEGCNDSGTMRVHGWPRVDVTSLGLTHERAARETFAFSRDGRTPGCSLD